MHRTGAHKEDKTFPKPILNTVQHKKGSNKSKNKAKPNINSNRISNRGINLKFRKTIGKNRLANNDPRNNQMKLNKLLSH